MANVSLRHIWKRYNSKVEAVKDLNLECKDKEFLCLLGPSGCGKTSTLRMIAGLESITSGDLFIGDSRVNDIAPKDRNIAMVFENYALYPHLTVYENIAIPLKVRGVDSGQIDRKVREVAAILQITDLLNRRTTNLSGGQKQRVGIGRAIVRNPAVFLMDEPISHLDAQLRAQMRGELKRLHVNLEATTVYVTHDQLEAMALADRIAVMNLGVLQQVGTPEELFDRPLNTFVAGFIGTPPMNFLGCWLEKGGDGPSLNGEGFVLPITDQMASRIADRKSEGELLLGIRPMDVQLGHAQGGSLTIPAETYVVEPAGEVCQVTVRIKGHMVRAETDAGFVTRPGETVWIGMDLDRIHLFDGQTGLNLLI